MPSLSRQWRSTAERDDEQALLARAVQEFPSLAEALARPHDRRRTLKLLAAGLALAGLGGCDDGAPSGVLKPPVRPAPASVTRGSHMFATANVLGGYGAGVLVRHTVGRPIKVEGNPDHPASLGGTDAIAQAEILGFYDPDRNAGMTRDGEPQDGQNLATALAAQRSQWAQNHGEGLRILTGTVTSPTLARQLAGLQQQYPAMRWHQWEPVSRDAVPAGALLAYGTPVELVPKLDAADVILAIDSDLLDSAPGHVRFAHDLMTRRNPARNRSMPRIYAIEPAPSLTGVAADHRFIASPRDLHQAVVGLADSVTRGGSTSLPWIGSVADDLRAHHGRAFVHVGPHQPAEMHALVHTINERLGGRGTTYELIEPVQAAPAASLHELVTDMQAGRVQSLILIDSNPVFAAPVSLGFAEALKRVPFSLALSVEANETTGKVHWFLPQRHSYEDWSDARAFDGTATIMQPQALPLFDGTSPHQLLAWLSSPIAPDPRDIVRQTWRGAGQSDADFEQWWHDALASGVLANTAAKRTDVALRPDAARARPAEPPASLVTLLFRPDPYLWDGRFANNAWLQELPRPLTKLTWDNPLLISPEQGRQLGVVNGDRVVVSAGSASLTLPAWIVQGQASDCAVAVLGFGRSVVGAVGTGSGFNTFILTGRNEPVTLRKGEGRDVLACTEHHDPMLARPEDFARHGTLAAFHADPDFLADRETTPSLYRWKPTGPAACGMSVDLNACLGCNACVVACMAENNIPVVGKEQVILEREMHWLRIDRYYEGDAQDPNVLFQPVLCMHCEQAPCEVVCPVGATVHDSEGLNVMVYNRCVGTRFCSNNCPYKVRRFNFYSFAAEEHRPPQARNPDVTVRARGVMEKCSFCLQRIAEARVAADIANRPVGGNEVRTACQAACPTQAFTFGNMAQPDAEVLTRKRSPLSYALLEDQNTHPRVTYEAHIDNPNPAVGGA
jgi:molybdopterin-containing oxidoreductase family iron-sulfur binding subunit